VAKTKELKKRSWGRRKAENYHVRFGKSRLVRAALPFSANLNSYQCEFILIYVIRNATCPGPDIYSASVHNMRYVRAQGVERCAVI